VTLPRQVRGFNRLHQAWMDASTREYHPPRPPGSERPGLFRGRASRRDAVVLALLEQARQSGGTLTVTEGVLATGQPFRVVDAALRELQGAGYVDVRNHPESGVVQYVFPELLRSPVKEAGST
jgi:hypothetical protein